MGHGGLVRHYVVRHVFAPLHACVIFNTVHNVGAWLDLPVFLLDDNGSLKGRAWQVVVRAYNGNLKEIKRQVYDGKGPIGSPLQAGRFQLDIDQTDTVPLLVVAEVLKDGALADRTFYWVNYEPTRGCLFRLPRTTVDLQVGGGAVTVRNTGGLPAVGVHVERPGHAHTFRASDNYFWLDVGESQSVEVSDTVGLVVRAWNAD